MRLWLSNYVEHEASAMLVAKFYSHMLNWLKAHAHIPKGVHNQIYAASIAESLRANGTTHTISAHPAAHLAGNSSSQAPAPAALSAALESRPPDAEGTVIQASRQRHRKHQRPRTRAKVLYEDDSEQQQQQQQQQQGLAAPAEQPAAAEEDLQQRVGGSAVPTAPAAPGPAGTGDAADSEDLGPALPGPNDEDAADAGAVGAEQANPGR